MLSLGIAGIPFVGADIPGFYGNASDEIFVMFY
jgi:alpha-glucosidase (family GH31 glycosyl hydrolase)